jgi:hypothetical protein
MTFFIQVIANYAGLIYIACIVGAAFYVREIVAARQELQQSLYSLEREAAGSRLWRSVMMLALLATIVGVTLLLQNVIAPQLASESISNTPTPAFTLPTNTPTPTFQPTPTRTPRPPTLPPDTPAATIEGAPAGSPTPPSLPPVVCPDPNVQIVAPIAGQAFAGDIQVRGTADAPNFAFYKFTLRGPATNNVEQTAGDVYRVPIRDGVLGSLNGAALLTQPGVYVLGLVVVDNTGNELPHCTVPIVIQSQ